MIRNSRPSWATRTPISEERISSTLVNVKFSSLQVSKIHNLFLFSASVRSKFYVREPVNAKPNWLKVGLTLGTSVFLWIYVSILPIGIPGTAVTNVCDVSCWSWEPNFGPLQAVHGS